ncbi:MAG: Hsp20/alpha crystallin family protein [Rubrobacter sp.]|nr:Hsp20/alpha crystallin family protein [Rubrobacter sp.]
MQRKGIERVDYGLGRSLRQVWGVMQEMSRMMEVAHGMDASPGSRGKPYEWEPVVSQMPTDEGLLLYFELPGVEREEVDLSVCGRNLRVSGVKKEIEVPEADALINGSSRVGGADLGSLRYSPFKCEVELPFYPNEEEVEATFGAGILQIRVMEDTTVRFPQRIHVRGKRKHRS